MTVLHRAFGVTTLSILILIVLSGCEKEEAVSFTQDVKPIIDKYCIECHRVGGEGHAASGLSMESYESLMKGATNGPMIIAGDSLGSNMLVLMEGRADPSIRMPHKKASGATRDELEIIGLWIDQGAKDN